MSISVWEPRKPVNVDLARLQALLRAYRAADPADVGAALDEAEKEAGASLMKLDESAWDAAERLEDADVSDLIRFFTLAEMQLPNWDGGERSPVIYLVRILKRREVFTPELRKWIKRNTDNRYLPHGPAL